MTAKQPVSHRKKLRDGGVIDRLDRGADRQLDLAADANQVILSGACMGTFTLKAPANVAAIEGCTSISGDLVVGGSGAYDSVPTTLTSVRLPVLTSIGGALLIPDNNPLLKTLELPELVSVAKDLRISKTPLMTLRLPKLTTVGWRLSIVDNAELTSLELPALSHVEQHFDMARHPRLTTFEVPSFATIGGSIFFSSNTVLTTIAAPKLKQVGDLLNIRNNWVLSSLQLPALTTVGGDFLIVENSQLPVCQVQAVLSRLVGFQGMVDTHNNSTTGTCN